MKKLVSVLLVFCLLVILAPAEAEDDVTGEWYLTRAHAAGTDMVVVSDEIQMTITLRADGTATLFSRLPGADEETAECTWAMADGVITFTDEDKTVTEARYADGEVSVEAEGAVMILTREQYTPYVMAAPVKAESMEAFYGTWVPDRTFQSGMMATVGDTLPADLRSKLVISAEGMAESSSEGTTVYENPVVDPETGILTAAFDVSGYTATIELTLLEDGTVLLTASVLGIEMVRSIYIPFTAAEDAA